jgi:multiple sugar transport system permease protein
LLFISPWLIGFLIWVAYPILASIYYSFTRYDVLRPPRWIGLENYRELIQDDELFVKSLYNTVYYAVFSIPLGNLTAFLLAVLLNSRIRFRSVLRTLFYIPAIVPTVAIAMLWMYILNYNIGLINNILVSLGLSRLPWLTSPDWAKPALILISVWGSGTTMLIYLAALQDVPQSLYDAAKVDGANIWRQFRHVTVPLVTPAILFNFLMWFIGVFQYFTFAWILTQGGPNNATEFYALYLYRNAFRYFKMGYASAMAWILFVIVVIGTVILFRSSARWVYYGGGGDEGAL